ncbi:unnamed protein product [Rotaria sp. Silwood1]|nr:unnamed protein product [Rotaria sp. Silwood1]CAF1605127.1 unnamed protein product [Rotaria sp. Silwood1]CAF3686729.1 unnamed protein product [Rotaria sp. Silwood1]CAF3729664.1 unnamed protein product [Rotaria sp. Silwood1]CAF3754896.1 unnamed protein product [Rotaria sp. Silwood1]
MRIEWATTAPRWRRARRGLCLEGQCPTSACEAFNRTVIMSLGFRRFDMLSDVGLATTKCPICKQYVEPVTCSFNNCWWRYEGIKRSQSQAPESCSCDWKHADDAYYRFDENHGEEVSWLKLVFEVVEQMSSEAPLNPVEVERETEEQTESIESRIWMPFTESNMSASTTTPPQSRLATAPIAVPASNQVSSSIEENTTNVNWFIRQGEFWCPWRSNNCTNKLAIPGQGVIEIMQRKSVPFELHLSNKSDPHDSEAYSIILSVNKNNVTLRTSTTELCTSTESFHVLQSEQGCWHRYWISLYAANRNVQYGIGEIRPLFSIFNTNITENESGLMKNICYLHVKMNSNENMLTELADLKYQIRFYISKNPIVYDYPLFIVPQHQYNLENYAFATCIPPSKLEKPCKHLYDTIINFQLNADDFPDLTSVIDKSIKNPKGWCHKKLIEKANRFGKSNIKATYLRLTVGEREGIAPGHSFVIEVWPPGHFSPIHNHGNAYGIIRVLYGEILVKLYPALTLNMPQYKPIEQICHEGTVTWMAPSLNQTHQVKHVDLYGKCCVSIQCYAYGPKDQEHYEFFDYIANDERSIGHFDPKSDMDFFDFKELMRQERQHVFSSSS